MVAIRSFQREGEVALGKPGAGAQNELVHPGCILSIILASSFLFRTLASNVTVLSNEIHSCSQLCVGLWFSE